MSISFTTIHIGISSTCRNNAKNDVIIETSISNDPSTTYLDIYQDLKSSDLSIPPLKIDKDFETKKEV